MTPPSGCRWTLNSVFSSFFFLWLFLCFSISQGNGLIIYLLLSLLFINGHKKGVEIAFCSILLSGLGVPITTDKTIAPHRNVILNHREWLWYNNQCRCHCQSYLRSNYKPPSSITKDKISITPFFNMYRCVWLSL